MLFPSFQFIVWTHKIFKFCMIFHSALITSRLWIIKKYQPIIMQAWSDGVFPALSSLSWRNWKCLKINVLWNYFGAREIECTASYFVTSSSTTQWVTDSVDHFVSNANRYRKVARAFPMIHHLVEIGSSNF